MQLHTVPKLIILPQHPKCNDQDSNTSSTEETDEGGTISLTQTSPYLKTIREIKEAGGSLYPRSKQRDKIARMLWNNYCEIGILVDVDSNGNIKYSVKTTLHFDHQNPKYDELFLCDRDKIADNHMLYIWTTKSKKIRIKHPSFRRNSKINKKQRRHERLKKRKMQADHEDDKNPSKSENPPKVNDIGRSAVDEIFEDPNDSEDEEEEESEDDGDTNQHKYKKNKKMSRKFRYLFSDAYICPKRSKKQRGWIKGLLTDVCDPLTKPMTESYTESYFTHETEEEDSYSYTCKRTLGNFFTTQNLDQLGLNSQFECFESLKPKEVEVINLSASDTDPGKSDATETIGVLCENEEDEEKGENENESISTIETDKKPISYQIEESIDIDEDKDSSKKTTINPARHNLVFLSHTSLRPDNLHAEFKEKYQEAQCKNRRFLLNISHLANQHLIRQQLLPLDIIAQSDISMYMVFIFVTTAETDRDKYRVWINSNLPLSKPSEMFQELIVKELTSIHELIHEAMKALDNPSVIDCIENTRKIKNKSITNLPTCTFHLLWSARLKLRLREPPQSKTESDILFVRGQNLSSQNLKVHQGPAMSSMCGICLQELNASNPSPVALTVCSHWFCEECWKLKLYGQIKKRDHESIICIEQGCSTAVDQTTLLSILDIKLVLKYHNINLKKLLREESSVMSCPNSSCKKSIFSQGFLTILQSNKPDQFMPVRCSCHWQYCYKCLESPHWPVSCDISKIYNKCLDAQNLHSFNRILRDDELPDMMLRGKSCPQCETFIQENNNQSKIEQCTCGCLFCWPCGKQVDKEMKDVHSLCLDRFELSDKALKAKMMKRAAESGPDIQISRWFKVALTHRQMRHPQVVRILYAMADRIASTAYELSESGKYIGDVKMASSGWKSNLRTWNERMCKKLQRTDRVSVNIDNNMANPETLPKSGGDRPFMISNDSVESGQVDEGIDNDSDSEKSLDTESTFEFPVMGQQPVKKESRQLIFKAMSNIVQIKLEVHHIIEHTAVMLEFDHSLSGNNGKIIRCLERAEDLCEALGLLLLHPHKDNIVRIPQSFLRLRLQVTNMLSTLYYNLKIVNN